MIKKKVFEKICNLSNSILKSRPTLSNLSNPFLFIVSGHSFFFDKVYKYKFKKN